MVNTCTSFRTAAHKSWRRFFDQVSKGRYRPPSRNQVKKILLQISQEIDDLKPAFIQTSKGTLVLDGATARKGEAFTNAFFE